MGGWGGGVGVNPSLVLDWHANRQISAAEQPRVCLL